VATLNAGEKRSSELVVSAMIRAHFCELLSPKIHHGEADLFLMGLLSMIDAILEIPMVWVLETISVDHETKAALMGAPGQHRPLYDHACA
jgi:c-di-GMP phosphodiesterase